jgi:antitoxin component of RelBE/YafQ-DinJ toxin-antitoxin module
MPNYGSYEYWNTRYAKEKKAQTTFDWLESYKDVRQIFF